ncbi:peptidase [Microcoleus sp. bin38.metabat.b11b12b14.051]|uniref:peptidase n=1 Tax=Microcoleus sp. bin38.metabat.b11b12b14.051 TaxID=2742709 RepID=UPI0026010DB9|nr:peptidase [Microcoleus sp. bin38.metabat.b11b12b14.051]
MRLWKVTRKLRLLASAGLALCCFSLIILTQVNAAAVSLAPLANNWPAPQVRALPPTLANWQDSTASGDYFDRVKEPKVGHLLWSKFPILVYVERPVDAKKSEEWVGAVLGVVREWAVYLPLQVVDSSEGADIRILCQAPPLRQGLLRSRSGESTYELYARVDGDKTVLSHRFSVYLNPNQVGKYVPATARHELGHALGIWGHSLLETDVLYFSQVRNPPAISARDVNTLKRIYQQPTRLGWEL